MNSWGRKIFVVLISVLTLGLYIPSTYVATDAAERNEVAPDLDDHREPTLEDVGEEDPVQKLVEEARNHTISKMGPRIIEKVDQDLTNEILPKIETIVMELLSDLDEEEVPYYELSEETNPGYGEKIFHLTNMRTGEELARFHVRRDKRPSEGYWFNFHYHVKDDQFMNHHTIGEIYWEKNTPPKWMS